MYNPLDSICKNAAGGLSGGGKEICEQAEIRVSFAWKRAHREPHLESAISIVKHRPLEGTVSITRMASHAGGVFFQRRS